MRNIGAVRSGLRSACLFGILSAALVGIAPALAVAPPGAMGAPTATGGALRATVAWNPPQSGDAPVAYTVRASSGRSASCDAPCTSLELALPPGTYTFTVTPENAGGPGPESGASNAVAVVKDDVVVTPTVAPGPAAYEPYEVSVAVDPATSGAYVPTGRIDVSDGNGATCTIESLDGGRGRCALVSTITSLMTITAIYGGDANFAENGGTVTVLVVAPTIAPAPDAVPAGTVGAPYPATAFAASGGTPPYTYTIAGGALPAGLALSADGVLSGTPRDGGPFDFVLLAKDAHGFPGTRAYTLSIAAPVLALAPDALPAAQAEAAYAQSFAASGGTGPYTYALAGGALPAGLALSPAGALAGTPLAAGTFAFRVRATDGSGGAGPYSIEKPYTLEVAPPTITLAPDALPPGHSGAAYPAVAFAATGGVAPYRYGVAGGSLPPGLSLGTDGRLTGTPAAGGTFTFEVAATDAHDFSGRRSYTIAVDAPALTLDPPALPAATAEAPYGQRFSAGGGVAPYAYALAGGALPDGLALAPDGLLVGTPLAAGTFAFSVRATDSSGGGPYSTVRDYTLSVAAPAIALSPQALPDARVGVRYAATIAADGGVAPYAYALAGGALPDGVSLAADGTLAGTPTAAGTFAFAVAATDAHGFAGTRDYAIAVSAGATAVLFGSSANPSTVGQAVTFTARVAPAGGAGRAPAVPGGTVRFAEGAATLAVVPLDASGTAAYATAQLGAGRHVLTAAYSGDARTAPASATLVQEVRPQGAPEPVAAPTLDRWAMLLLIAGLAAFAAVRRRRAG